MIGNSLFEVVKEQDYEAAVNMWNPEPEKEALLYPSSAEIEGQANNSICQQILTEMFRQGQIPGYGYDGNGNRVPFIGSDGQPLLRSVGDYSWRWRKSDRDGETAHNSGAQLLGRTRKTVASSFHHQRRTSGEQDLGGHRLPNMIDKFLSVRGKKIISVRRVFYVFDDDVETSKGAVELVFDDSSVLLLDSGADGEQLRVGNERWVDPFEGKMTPENIEYIAKSGKYSAFDVSSEMPYRQLVGSVVDDVEPMTLPDGAVSGVSFLIGPVTISARTIADELIVS